MKKYKKITILKRLITCTLAALLLISNSFHENYFSKINNGTESPKIEISGINPLDDKDSGN